MQKHRWARLRVAASIVKAEQKRGKLTVTSLRKMVKADLEAMLAE